MRTELDFFNDERAANEYLGLDRTIDGRELELGMFQRDDNFSLMARTLYSVAKSNHERFLARQVQEVGTPNAPPEPEAFHLPGPGFPAPPDSGGPVSMGVYCGSGEDQPLQYSVWSGVHLGIPIPKPNPVAGQHSNLGLELGMGIRRTRNFLGEMGPLNPNAATTTPGALPLNLRLGTPDHFIVTDPIVKLEEPENEDEAIAVAFGGEEAVDLELKL